MIKQEQIAEKPIKVQHLGPFVVDQTHAHNSYLILSDDADILVDVPPIQVFDLLKISLNKFIEINELTHMIIQQTHISSANVIIELIDEGFKGKILTNQYLARQIRNLNIPIEIICIEDAQYRMNIGKTMFMGFIPMMFLPIPQMFMTYLPTVQTLLSSTLFSSFYSKADASIDEIKKSLFQYHRLMMPSSDYIKPVLSRVNSLMIKQIFPAAGYLIQPDKIADIIEFESSLDFYNNAQVFKYGYEAKKETNYIEIINHMIVILQKHFSNIEILNTFVGTKLSLSNDTLVLKRSVLEGYKLWNAFFDHIYVKKGIMWLSILEPTVNKYYTDYEIEKPTVYRSLFTTMAMQVQNLGKAKSELEIHLEQLKNQVEKTKDQILRCPITKLFIESVLREILAQDLSIKQEKPQLRGMILVQLDQLNDINKKYGKDAGDEAIRNMAYQLYQVKDRETQLYKQAGPGIIIYENNVTEEQLQKTAVSARNSINDSNLFIEKVSASVSIVSDSEINRTLSIEDQVKAMFSLLEKRMIFAKHKGQGEIIDQKTESKVLSEGCILLVDEDEVNRNMLFRIFKRINFDVKLAKDVEEALELINIYPIDIIISEINLSKIDGFSLKQTLNETKDYKKIPFIMVSHNKTVENIKRGNTLDVDLILAKPIVPEEIVGIIKRIKDRKYSL
ncbi:MAG: hypothetical protein A2009_05780 [Tenericutes bacterium GWD2_38_27]|nr:MAG: hypothetical protein A2009_05780 [Tenericutes bacterium GWD2_38_27]